MTRESRLKEYANPTRAGNWNGAGRDQANLALQLRFLTDSESIGNHDSKIVGACGVD
jgi:hypothetical protein